MNPLAPLGSYSFNPGQTTPSIREFYNRTLRPLGRLGNGNIRLIFPLSIPAPITSIFGWRIHPITGEQRFHSGTDLGAPLGTPVLAAYAGQVAIADFLGGYGLTVALRHNKDTQETLYGHLSELFVRPGEWVQQGMVIGRVGSTGNSTGPHLHFEFRQMGPDGWIALDAGQQLEYALAQLVKSMQVARLTPAASIDKLSNGAIGVVNLGARG
jgi:murein DD-endopeptidase MepM/ murein hydrolase activator NlpD